MVGSGFLIDIFGMISSIYDVDFFLINIMDFVFFLVMMINSGIDGLLDLQLFLLIISGKVICVNDNV